ncbi:MAG: hypothetical protein HKN12_09555 [Gemmatimonadetes bacterium]|nr:hypothetical protein [Gemmatimonadota bacterium]
MRRIPLLKVILVSLLTAALLTGCGSGSPTGPGGSGGTGATGGGTGGGGGGGTFGGTMTATLDGAPWNASIVTANATGTFIAVGASDASGLAVGFNFDQTGPGSYPIASGETTQALIATQAGVWNAGGVVGSGELVITVLTATRVAGTFTFTFDGPGLTPATRSLTAGSFDVEF